MGTPLSKSVKPSSLFFRIGYSVDAASCYTVAERANMRNRIKELREQRGWTLDELAQRIVPPTTASQISKLERAERRLDTGWIERIAAAFGVDPLVLLDDRPATGASGPQPDVAPLSVGGAKPGSLERYRVISHALDELGLAPGDVVEVDTAVTGTAGLATGDVVLAEVETAPGLVTQIMRQWIEPCLLTTNSRAANEMPLNARSLPTRIVGLVVSSHRVLRRAR
jgi:transcriptional regulator with XRE-family HTH domain